jgi:hypothetical protein
MVKVASLPLVVGPHFRPWWSLDLPCGHKILVASVHQGMVVVVVRSLFRGKLMMVAKRHLSDTLISLVGKLVVVTKMNIFKTLVWDLKKVKMSTKMILSKTMD